MAAYAGPFPGNTGTETVKKKVSDTTLGGRKYITESRNYYKGFSASNDEEFKDAANAAFKSEAIETREIPSGHIRKLEYASHDRLLRVTFYNGAVVIYRDIASALAGELLKLAETGATMRDRKGAERHLLGIRFWELIRIKHHRYGSAKPFLYQKHSSYKYINSNKRYLIQINRDNYDAIAKFYRGNGTLNMPTNTDLGSFIESPFSEQELIAMANGAKITDDYKLDGDIYDAKHRGKISQLPTDFADNDDYNDGSSTSDDIEYDAQGNKVEYGPSAADYGYAPSAEDVVLSQEAAREAARNGTSNSPSASDNVDADSELELLRSKLSDARRKFTADYTTKKRIEYSNKVNDKMAELMSTGAFDDISESKLRSNVYKLYGLEGKLLKKVDDLTEHAYRRNGRINELIEGGYINKEDVTKLRELEKKSNMNKTAGGVMRHVWTANELINMGGQGPTAVKPEHRPAYINILRECVNEGSFEKALRFLKDTQGDTYRYDTKTHAYKHVKDTHYADEWDTWTWGPGA